MNINDLEKIEKEALLRYSERYRQFGNDPKSLGWDSLKNQIIRFDQVCSIGLRNKRILDVGCGFCDLYLQILNKNIKVEHYSGWEINQNFITFVKEKYGDEFDIKKQNIANIGIENYQGKYDIVVLLGLLNFKLKSEMENYSYSEYIIKKAFDITSECVVVDFLSENRTPSYPKEASVFYHSVEKVSKIISNISSNFYIKHDYRPIPQKEFMCVLFK